MKKNVVKKNETNKHEEVCISQLSEPEQGSVLDSLIKIERKVRSQKQETNVNNRKYREFLAKRNVLTITEEASFNQKGFEEEFLKSIDTILVDYIQTEFTIKELYIFFFGCYDGYFMSEEGFLLAKQQAIEFINAQYSLSSDDKKRMKRKVWDTNFILFGLIVDFVQRYEIFDGSAEERRSLKID